MRAVLGVADLILGLAFLLSTGLVLHGMPAAAGRYRREPEDLWILAVLLLLSLLSGLAALLASSTLLRGRPPNRLSAAGVMRLVLASAAILLALAVVGFVGDESELRLLAVPAGVLGWSAFALRRSASGGATKA